MESALIVISQRQSIKSDALDYLHFLSYALPSIQFLVLRKLFVCI